MKTIDDEYNFDFVGYRPQWIEYEQIEAQVKKLFSDALGLRLQDIRGVVSEDGWGPDWPIILCFGSMSISLNTKCDRVWAIDEWRNEYYLHENINEESAYSFLKEDTLMKMLNVHGLLGKELKAVTWPSDRSYEFKQGFSFTFGEVFLWIYDAGDELGLRVLDAQNRSKVSDYWETICLK